MVSQRLTRESKGMTNQKKPHQPCNTNHMSSHTTSLKSSKGGELILHP